MAKPKVVMVESVPLDDVFKRVQSAFDEYHKTHKQKGLPALNSADFTFKASTKKTGGVSITIVVFKFGAKHTTETTQELLFNYAVPKPKAELDLLGGKIDSVPLEKELVTVMEELGTAFQKARDLKLDGVSFKSTSMTVQFAITNAFEVDGTVTYDLVTIAGLGGVDTSSTHSIKLTFEDTKNPETIDAVVFSSPIYMSEKTYAALKKYVGVEPPPAECHLEASETPEGGLEYACVGSCPKLPTPKICALQMKEEQKGGKKKYTYYCACA